MQLILLQKVDNLGDLGDMVDVRSGFARNFLLPKGMAKVANDANVAEFLPEGPIRLVGEHEVGLHLHSDVDVTLTVTVTAEA